MEHATVQKFLHDHGMEIITIAFAKGFVIPCLIHYQHLPYPRIKLHQAVVEFSVDYTPAKKISVHSIPEFYVNNIAQYPYPFCFAKLKLYK